MILRAECALAISGSCVNSGFNTQRRTRRINPIRLRLNYRFPRFVQPKREVSLSLETNVDAPNKSAGLHDPDSGRGGRFDGGAVGSIGKFRLLTARPTLS